MARLLNCNYCKKDYYSKSRNYKSKYCSHKCAGHANQSITKFRQGMIPWNKGIKHVQVTGENSPTKRPEVKQKIKEGIKF